MLQIPLTHYTYILCHGFGFSNDYWRNLLPYVSNDVVFFDDLDNLKIATNKKYIGIGHSLGFLKLNNSNITFEYLIGLQGFINFCGNNMNMRKIREKNLKRVIIDFETDHTLALTNFHRACGCESSRDITKIEIMKDLNLMKRTYQHCGTKTLMIGTTEDKIVPMSLIKDNFSAISNVTITEEEGCGHSLGFNLVHKISKRIQEFITK